MPQSDEEFWDKELHALRHRLPCHLAARDPDGPDDVIVPGKWKWLH